MKTAIEQVEALKPVWKPLALEMPEIIQYLPMAQVMIISRHSRIKKMDGQYS
jgi:hypothetical protein